MVTIIISIFSLIVSFFALILTYHVYKMNYRHSQIDSYLKQIIKLYYDIEKDGKIVKLRKNDKSNEMILAQCYSQIEINASLMRYYVRKFPDSYKEKDCFVKVLESIAHSPEELNDYDKLSDEFKTFCKNIEEAKDPESFIERVMQTRIIKPKNYDRTTI